MRREDFYKALREKDSITGGYGFKINFPSKEFFKEERERIKRVKEFVEALEFLDSHKIVKVYSEYKSHKGRYISIYVYVFYSEIDVEFWLPSDYEASREGLLKALDDYERASFSIEQEVNKQLTRKEEYAALTILEFLPDKEDEEEEDEE